MFKNEQFKMKEDVFVKNYFAHCVDVEELYENMVSPVCEKYELTYMEFTVLMFLANNPQYDTATQIVRYRHLAKVPCICFHSFLTGTRIDFRGT